ncbi:hypothetical protein [uncultured Thermanaerothrix sp.]|uniref:hypothetical protein n=1 Tax=uncultured Thermanaerothrix sp. TaxID=1195149 RepID=UPI00262B13E8|nr:hypothetical protein [uncultured Thermanaerothrix sp.]
MLPEMLVATFRARGRWLLGWGAGVLIAIFMWGIWARVLPLNNLLGWLGLAFDAEAGKDAFLFTLVLPWLVGIPVLSAATRWLGEPASRETIAFLLTLPVPRWALFLNGWGFHMLLLFVFLGISLVGLLIEQGIFGGEWGVGRSVTHVVALGLLLGLAMQSGMLVALYTASFRLGFGGALGGLLVSLLLYGWSRHVPFLSWLRFFLPWYYYLAGGWSEGGGGFLGVMGGINLVLGVWLAWAFIRGRIMEAPQRAKDKETLTER